MSENKPNWLKHFQERKPQIMDHENYLHFALLVPLIERDGELHFVFEIRAQNIRQPGEICFPGGKVDDTDLSHEDAALRELHEELGIHPTQVHLVGSLDYMITPFRLMLYPFLGIIDSQAEIIRNDAEVTEVFFVPLSELLKMAPKEHNIYLEVQPEKEFPFHLIPNGENYNWRKATVNEQFYEYDGKVIWGLTARILTHVLHEIKQVDELN